MSEPSGWSLRRRLTNAIVGVLLLLMVLIATAVYYVDRAKDAGDELVDQWDPAFQISQNTLTAMVNEETGVRGYALGRDEAFLEPYNLANLLGGSAQGTLRKYLIGYPDLLDELKVLNAAIDAWHTQVADPIIAQVRAGDPGAAEAAGSEAARAAFDDIRRRYRNEPPFRDSVNRYVKEFERLLAKIGQSDRDGAQSRLAMLSDSGKVYVLLAHASGRLG